MEWHTGYAGQSFLAEISFDRSLEGVYMRPKMKFLFAMKQILFTLVFIVGEMK